MAPSKFIPCNDVHVIVSVKLPEGGGLGFPPEEIGPDRSPEGIRHAVSDLRDEIVVLIRRAVEGKEGQPEGLVAEKLGQADGQQLAQSVLNRKTRGQRVAVW